MVETGRIGFIVQMLRNDVERGRIGLVELVRKADGCSFLYLWDVVRVEC